MVEHKFKLGEAVRVLDGSDIEGYTYGWGLGMDMFVGNVYTIRNLTAHDGLPAYELNIGNVRGCFIFDERGVEKYLEVELKEGELMDFLEGM